MTIEEPEPTQSSDQWLDSIDTIPCFSSLLVDLYGDQWWDQAQDVDPERVNTAIGATSFTSTTTTPPEPIASSDPQPFDSSKKRKASNHRVPKACRNRGKNRNRRTNEADEQGVTVKKSVGTKRGSVKSAGNNCNNGNNREGRWAEQLLNPCAVAITAGDRPRVQHFLYVLHELASPTGDANYRLAAHGLRALIHHLSSTCPVSGGAINFASTEPQLFRKSLTGFDMVSPWFIFPNVIANNSILQILSEQDHRSSSTLHIVDIGVSHGVQWPTLLEALSRLPGGSPPLVRLTVVGAEASDHYRSKDIPFAVGPPGYSYTSQLLCFAKSMNINLKINQIDNLPLQNLNAQIINCSLEETLIVCAQFRLHHLNHNSPDDRTQFLRVLRSLNPKGVILSENNIDCSCSNCGDFTTSFSRRVEYLWRFLDSTSVAFKRRESDERRVMEGEAAKALTNLDEMNEGKEKWCERMRRDGFAGEMFGEDTIDEARALLRRYDSNWEMREEEEDGCLGLWWKGQPVSFCSLWK